MTDEAKQSTAEPMSGSGGGTFALDALGLLAYPIAAWYALTRAPPEAAGWLMLAAMAPRTWVLARRATAASRREIFGPPVAIGVLVAASVVFDAPRYLLALPVLIAGTLLFAFARSLRYTPMVEHYARLAQPDLTPAEIRHCRQATWAWCVFFILNGALSAWLAIEAEPATWALYTGLGSYLAMSVLFAVEYAVRVVRFGFVRATPRWKRGTEGAS